MLPPHTSHCYLQRSYFNLIIRDGHISWNLRFCKPLELLWGEQEKEATKDEADHIFPL